MNRIETTIAHIGDAAIAAFPQYTKVWCQYCLAGKGRVILLFTLFDSTGYTMRSMEFKNFVQVKEVKETNTFEVIPALTQQTDNIINHLNKVLINK